MGGKVTRRGLLKVLGSSSVMSLPACGGEDDAPASPSGFFTDAERRALGALANVVIPPEPGAPGGGELGAASYIERLLTAFDVDPPTIFADGPFSGRQPLPDGKGGAGAFPPNDFLRFRSLDRVTEKIWRVKIYGSKSAFEGPLNDGLVPAVVGLRDLFKEGLASAMKDAKAPLETLSLDELKDVFGALDTDLKKKLVDLVSQAAFGAPEYGGNLAVAGWKLVHFDGDSQPLGYSLFDAGPGVYRERPGAPMSTKDPAADPAPLDDGTRAIMAQVLALTDGKVFP